jgi:hypothetical protein
MEKREILRLEKENADLKAELVKVICTLKMESDSTTKHIKCLYQRIKLLDDYIGRIEKNLSQHIANLHDIVAPIEQKIFPAAKNTRKQIASIIGPKSLGARKDTDKKRT